jgi:hypothetical protein
LTVSLAGGKPHIQGKLTIAELFLEDIGINQRLAVPVSVPARAKPETSEQPASEASATVVDAPVIANPETPASADNQSIFDREPLNFTGLQQFNLDLDISINQITGADFSIDKLAGQVKLTDGALRIPPMRVTFDGGAADLELAVDTRKALSMALKVTADDLLLAGVVPHLQPEMQIQGKARLHIDIKSKGRSVHELVSGLAGEASLVLDNARLPRRYLDYLSADGSEPSAASDAYTMLEIDGTVAVKFGSEVEIIAEAVHLRTDDGSYDLSLGKLKLQQNLALYLKTGELWIDNLSVADLHAEIIVTEAEQDHGLPEDAPPDHDWHEFDWQIDDLPFVLVETMQLSNISLVYTEGDQRDRFSLSSLVLDNDNAEEPMTLNAAGLVNERSLKLEGTVGTPAQPRSKNQVYPINYTLSSGTVDVPPDKPVIRFNGSVDRSLPGGGLIKGSFEVAVAELVSIFNQEKTADKLGHLQGSLEFADVDGRWGIKKLKLTSTGTNLYQLNFEGTVDTSDKFDLRTQIEVPDPAAFGAQLGIDLTGYAAYKGEGVLTGNRQRFDYKGSASIGRTENELTLAMSLVAGKPFIQGRSITPVLYLPDFGINKPLAVPEDVPETAPKTANRVHSEKAKHELAPVVDASVTEDAGTSEPPEAETSAPVTADSLIVFAREPLDFSGLQVFNLDLDILIDEIIGVDYTIDKLAGRIKLTDGVLHISPMRLTFEGGVTDLDFLLDSRNTPSVTLKVTADDLVLGKMIADVQKEVPVTGKAHLNIDITSNGHSPHELASDLSGEVSFSLENARLPTIYVEFLSADVFGLFARMITFEDSYTTLNCVMTGFDIDQGVMTSKLLFADGPQLAIEGTATIDLGQETIDMELLPKKKKSFYSSISAVKVTGPLADPNVETSSSKAVAVTVGAAVLVPQIIIPVFLIEQLWKRVFSSDDDSGCANFIAAHEVKQQKAAQEKAE